MESSRSEGFKEIAEHGDIFDSDHTLSRNPRLHLTPWVVAGYYSSVHGLEISADSILSITALSIGLFGAGSLSKHFLRKRELDTARKNTELALHEIDEPIDIIRYKDGEIALRWYGLDGIDVDTTDTASMRTRAAAVADYAKRNDVSLVAIGGDLHTGSDMTGEKYISNTKDIRYADLYDGICDERVIETTPGYLIRTVEGIINPGGDTDLRTMIIGKLGDRYLAELNCYYDTNPEVISAKMRSAVRLAIERELDDVEIIKERSQNGDIFVRRASVLRRIHGSNLASATYSRSLASGSEELEYMHEGSLLKATKFKTVPELFKYLSEQEDAGLPTRIEQLVGLYELLADPSRQSTFYNGDASSHADTELVPSDGVQSLFSRMYDKGAKGGADQVVERRGRSKFALLNTLGLVGMAGTGMILGLSINFGASRSENRDATRYARYVVNNELLEQFESADTVAGSIDRNSNRYKQFLADQTSKLAAFDSFGSRAKDRLDKFDQSIADAITGALASGIGADSLQNILPSYISPEQREWISAIDARRDQVSTPPYLYRDNADQYFGDVSDTSNAALFSIKQLGPESSRGYWYTGTADGLTVSQQLSAPFEDGGVYISQTHEDGKQYSTEEDFYDGIEADFEVETPYVGMEDFDNGDYTPQLVLLPIKQNYKILSARLIDQDTGKTSSVLLRSNQYGPYAAMVDDKPGSLRMKKPMIQYKLRRTESDMYRAQDVLNKDGLITPTGIDPSPNELERLAVAASVRSALGLPNDASPEQILDAIRNRKEYSYSPFTREGVDSVEVGTDNPYGVMIDVGQALAQLDTMNCNLAALEYLLARYDSSEPLAMGFGYHEDGDTILSRQEAHAWVVDEYGAIIDPTPTKLADGEAVRTLNDTEVAERGERKPFSVPLSPLLGAEVALSAVLGAVAWRRRREIAGLTDKARAFSSLAIPAMQHEVTRMQRELFDREDIATIPKAEPVVDVATAIEQYVRNMPTGGGPRGTTTLSSLRRAWIQLNDAAIRREASHK